ncbi:polysaccharide biosynthesis C-terminal domain-containing protein [Segetibacter aerophilus]|nr:polysaccharide biosynthesis C-terminal domain-containing protein [Segetibacter aerophilus]
MKKALLDSFLWRGIYFITTLLLNVCIARIYEAPQSGWIYFISNNFFLVVLIGGVSLDSSMTYFSASNQISGNKLALVSIIWPFIVAIFSVGCTMFLISQHFITSDYLFLLVAGVAYTFGISLNNFFTSLFYARQNYAVPNILMSAINVIVIILVPFFAKGFMGLNREQFLYIYFLQFILQGLGLAILYLTLYSPVSKLQLPTLQEYKMLFRFAVIALFANIAYYLINRVDYLFVEAWCSAKSLGNYVQVSKMGQLFLIIPSIIASAVYPQAAKGENANMVKYIVRMITLFVPLYIIIIIASYLFSSPVFLWLFGKTFDEMYVPFLVLLPGILFLSMHIIIAAFFGAKNKPAYNVISTSAGLVIVLIGDVVLIKRMGITGAALVSSLGYTTAFIVSLLLFMQQATIGWKDIFTSETFKLKTYTSLIANRSPNSK